MQSSTVLAGLTPLGRLSALNSLLANMDGQPDSASVVARLTPLQGIVVANAHHSVETSAVVQQLLNMLTAMRAVDFVFEEQLGYRRHAYALDDATIGQLVLTHCDVETAPTTDLFELLSTLGLIYRFNVAPKFGIDDPGRMQLRLNGWGRIAFDSLGCAANDSYGKMVKTVGRRVADNRDQYLELLALCNAETRPLATDRIKQLLQVLPILIVS